ncbi:MAG TPA: CDP-alcohol phosphatidyltransferase family protein [Microthrixaceae bacterium]|nr:CDP-alcohol phosphatidyltransferase family protein [Microthrixaceae bacterium]
MGEQGSGTPSAQPVVSDRVLTIPNLLSMLRLALVPVFLWLILAERDGAALAVLAGSAITDYLDGKIARTFGMVSRLGQLLDPIADRLFIVSTLVGLALRSIIPWWLVALLLARELVMLVVVLLLKRVGIIGLPVHFVGKAATFNLLYAFPVLLLGEALEWARAVGWAFAWWGVALYWLAAVLYAVHAAALLRSPARGPREALG